MLANCKVARLVCVSIWGLTAVPPVLAQGAHLLVVQNDRGGAIGARLIAIAQANDAGTRIELRGRFCYSSCTLYLGADDICISPHTIFGFHGPSRQGQPLPPSEFEHWSQIMAAQYSAPLRDWFLATARHRISGYYRLRGAQLIAMGYAPC